MAKANIKTSGAVITVEGSAEEVAKIISFIKKGETSANNFSRPRTTHKTSHSQKNTPTNLISSLIDGGFFKKPKDLASVKISLEEAGHYYQVTSLSPVLLRLVRKHQLRRIKQKNKWLYVNS